MTETMTWREAELRAADHMQSLGFHDAEATPAGTDKGVDVRASDGIAQVKHYTSSLVGSPEIQRLRGAAHEARWALFYAKSGYTAAAVDVAEQTNVALFTYTNEVVTPANEHARSLGKSGYLPVDFGNGTAIRQQMLDHIAMYAQQTLRLLIEAVSIVKPLLPNLVKGIESLTDRHKENVREIIAMLPEVNQVVEELHSGETYIQTIFAKIARLEYFAMIVADVSGESLEALVARVAATQTESGFVPSAKMKR